MNTYYHGSSNGKIDILLPKRISTSENQNDERVWCTFDKGLAAIFALNRHDEIAILDWNKINGEREKVFLILDKERVKDNGGYIYTLPENIQPIKHNCLNSIIGVHKNQYIKNIYHHYLNI